MFLSGGPGPGRAPADADVAELLEPLRASYDIVTVDQRGTGDSGAVECTSRPSTDVAACATLGDRRRYWNTPETAKDLENLRVALGVDKLTLFGVSYGAKVAAEYARRYPARRRRSCSTRPRRSTGSTARTSCARWARRACCARSASPGLCAARCSDPDDALTAAVERLRRGAVRGPLVTLRARQHRDA